MTHAVATRAMIPAGGGKIVSVTLSPHHGLPGMAHSSAARAAVENLMRVLSIEWSRFDIKLNAIAAGQFGTETLLTKYPQPIVDSLASSIPLGRLGEPKQIAWLVALLASPAGDFFSARCSRSTAPATTGRARGRRPSPRSTTASRWPRPGARRRRSSHDRAARLPRPACP